MRNDNGPLDDLLHDCCRELFAAYALEPYPQSREQFPKTAELAFCGVIGFAGKKMRGALVLATTAEALELRRTQSLSEQRDWVCELANQLMGRVKNRLLLRGVEVLLATPASVSGNNLCPTPAHLRAPQIFAAGRGYVCAWIDCEMDKGFELPTSGLPNMELPIAEGDVLLF